MRSEIKTMNYKFKSAGFSLIELMVAMVIGVIILLGLVSLFTSSSALNRAQTGLSVLQENGRYAITRIKADIELAGRKHCATLALPNEIVVDWDQGYLMNSWSVDANVNFNNGWPLASQVRLDSVTDSDTDQIGDVPFTGTSLTAFPLDPAFFIRGHECNGGACLPATTAVGADSSVTIAAGGNGDGSRALNTDVLTVRYLTGGTQVSNIAGSTITLNQDPAVLNANDIAIVSDCNNTYVANSNWGGTTVNMSGNMPALDASSDTKLFSYSEDLRTVTYHLELSTDLNDSTRLISNLMRTQNGVSQVLVEGVERFDVFYLAQLQTGHVARLTAAQVEGVNGGGDVDGNGFIDGVQGCTQPPRVSSAVGAQNLGLANDNGCLWRSIYAIEVNLLLNTVNNSSTVDDDTFVYTPDSTDRQNPTAGLPSGLPPERMYRREFNAVVPVRSYTL